MESLVKIFFFNHLPLERRKQLLQNYIGRINKLLETLQELENSLTDKRVDYHVSQTLRFGIDYYDFKKSWFSNLLKNEDEVQLK